MEGNSAAKSPSHGGVQIVVNGLIQAVTSYGASSLWVNIGLVTLAGKILDFGVDKVDGTVSFEEPLEWSGWN